MMKTITAADARNKFGVLMDIVQKEAVAISKQGRTTAIVLPVDEYEEYKSLKLESLRRHVAESVAQADSGESSKKTMDEIQQETKLEFNEQKI